MIRPEIQHFIEENIELIDQNDYISLYYEWCEESHMTYFCEVYDTLLSADIDMLLHMDRIPAEFFMSYTTRELIIPDNIKIIEQSAFRAMICDRLVLPPSIIAAHGYLFSDSSINRIEWPGNPDIAHNSFFGSDFDDTTFRIEQDSLIDQSLRGRFESPPFQIEYI